MTQQPLGGTGSIRRRTLLGASLLALGGLPLAQGLIAASAGARGAAFHALACLLTERPDLSPQLVERARGALLAQDAAVVARLDTLAAHCGQGRPFDLAAFRASPLAQDAAMMAAAMALVSALYLGAVGKGWHGHLVSYEEALMFRSTADVTIIPTYTRAIDGWWAQAPEA